MRNFIGWVETGVAGRLAIMARPRGGDWLEDEVQRLRDEGVQTVVSLLQEEEAYLQGLEGERHACERAGLAFLSFPIEDRTVPPCDATLLDFLHGLRDDVRAGGSVVIHCRAGIGRSSVIASSVLFLLGILPEESLKRLSEARGLDVPDTGEQYQWIHDFPAFVQRSMKTEEGGR